LKIYRLLIFVSGLKVDYMIPKNPSSKRTYKVNAIAECPAKLWYVFPFVGCSHIGMFIHLSAVEG
jgi:hypothetical protein